MFNRKLLAVVAGIVVLAVVAGIINGLSTPTLDCSAEETVESVERVAKQMMERAIKPVPREHRGSITTNVSEFETTEMRDATHSCTAKLTFTRELGGLLLPDGKPGEHRIGYSVHLESGESKVRVDPFVDDMEGWLSDMELMHILGDMMEEKFGDGF